MNALSDELKDSYWLNNRKITKKMDFDGNFTYNWYYFPIDKVWMCMVYDKQNLKENKEIVSDRLFFNERVDITQINKQWRDRL